MSWDDLQRQFRERLTTEQATLVRQLRVDQALTWRGVSEGFFDLHPNELYGLDLRGNQGVGMFLCEAAAAILGKDSGSAPWN